MSQGPANFNQTSRADEVNPYAPSAAVGTVTSGLTDVETLRKTHLSHEASVKAVGTLYLLGAILSVPSGIYVIAAALSGQPPSKVAVMIPLGLIYLGFGLLAGYVGLGLRRLTNAGRRVGIVFGAIGLIAFPIGTLISVYVLYLFLSANGKRVFSDHYRQVIAQTPHIKHKTSIVWVLLGLVLALLQLRILAD